ncbi:hypothetical protein EV699_12362 [Plasticicumulans lactativorans]|uniref:Uncharacterized protein n=1 Tax=Plasticicumulans lactativorans TaxID=1133106 RepID=A0A4R2LFY7_9GAMM|nr:hypothetical protein [Plasticicumulans lactativorans]TCO78185.1 hypothetical protein EV699_12362 [Plasticicumulans lactativorans]
MMPFWMDFGARAWFAAQLSLLNHSLALMQLFDARPPLRVRTGACPACGVTMAWIEHREDHHRHQRCPACGLIRFQAYRQREQPAEGAAHDVVSFRTGPRSRQQ